MLCPTCNQESLEGTFYECPNEHVWWAPNPGPQTRFLECGAHEILYGGAAGGGKSAALVMNPLRWVDHPHFKGVLIRRETGQLEELIDLARHWYPRVVPGCRIKWDGKAATGLFPSGAKIIFGHCKDERDWENYQGKQYQYIGFDELTHFTETQYLKIKSRTRAAHGGLPRFTRATSNPGGVGHEWVFARWGAWLNPKFLEEHDAPGLEPRTEKLVTVIGGKTTIEEKQLPPIPSGKVAWIEKGRDGKERYLPCKPEKVDDAIHGSRVFIGAKVSDNRVLMHHDPGYVRNLADLDAVTRAQHLDGDWLAKPAKGLYFKRAWWKLLKAPPAFVKGSGQLCVRYWDRAGSEEDRSDWTAGIKMIRFADRYAIVDLVHFQGSPGAVEQAIFNTAQLDGQDVTQFLELDPGQAGKAEMLSYMKLLAGYDVRPWRPSGDKVTRAGTLSSQVEAGNVDLVIAPWTEKLLSQLEAFPEDEHDDIVDACSGAFTTLFLLGGGSSKAAANGHRPLSPPGGGGLTLE